MSTSDGRPSVAVAIPAYNEEGLPQFLQELDGVLSQLASEVTFHVVDDRSPGDMVEQVEIAASSLKGTVEVVTNEVNSGHGPTVVRAYRQALASNKDIVVQVDGDGQFYADDLRLLFAALDAGADVASGVRISREDPWFRRVLSAGLRVYLFGLARVRVHDPNCPFRAYRRDALEDIIAAVPDQAMVPTVYLSALAPRRGHEVREVFVRHRARLGTSAQGTMWGRKKARSLLIPKKLLVFVGGAFRESIGMRDELRSRNAR